MRISDWSSDVCSSDLDNALLRLLHAVELAADLVAAHELDADSAVSTLFQIGGEGQTAGAFDQQVALIEAGGAELQRHLGLGLEALLVGRVGRLGKARGRDNSGY